MKWNSHYNKEKLNNEVSGENVSVSGMTDFVFCYTWHVMMNTFLSGLAQYTNMYNDSYGDITHTMIAYYGN